VSMLTQRASAAIVAQAARTSSQRPATPGR
jgi:hypothetical protein